MGDGLTKTGQQQTKSNSASENPGNTAARIPKQVNFADKFYLVVLKIVYYIEWLLQYLNFRNMQAK